MTQPLRMDWNLMGNQASLSSIITAAHNLASRFCGTVKVIRSWDVAASHIYKLNEDFLIIIDSICSELTLFISFRKVVYGTDQMTQI